MYNILCVNDVEANLLELESLFESKSERYNLTLVKSGEEALITLLKESIEKETNKPTDLVSSSMAKSAVPVINPDVQ